MAQDVIRETRIVRDEGEQQGEPAASTLVARIITLAGSLLVSLLALRFLLMLLGARAGNAFVDFVYDLSRLFVAPFFGMFGYTPQYGTSRLEVETLVAIIVYGFLTWLFAYIATINSRRAE